MLQFVHGAMKPWGEGIVVFSGHGALTRREWPPESLAPGIHLTQGSWVSVVYAEGLNSAKSSVTLRSTDRHEIVGEKPTDFQARRNGTGMPERPGLVASPP